MRVTERGLIATLRRHGYKVTLPRQAVIRAITSAQDHLTPASIYERVRQEHPGIGLVTIYRTLEILSEMGLICEVHAGGSCRSYLVRGAAEHHHHLLCSNCGLVVDFSECGLDELEDNLSRRTGFKVEDHLLEFLGLCPACQAKNMKFV